jgi:hypothetical protein
LLRTTDGSCSREGVWRRAHGDGESNNALARRSRDEVDVEIRPGCD